MRSTFRAGIVAVAVAASGQLAMAGPPSYDAQLDAARDRHERGIAAFSAAPPMPRIAWTATGLAPRADAPAEAARAHLKAHAARHRLPRSAVHTAEVLEIHDTGRGGIIVRFGQRADGYEVVGARASVLMTRDLELVAVSGALVPQAAAGLVGRARFALSPDQAIAAAIQDRYGAHVALAPGGERRGGYHAYAVAPSARASGVHLVEPARVKPVLYPLDGQLIPAYALHFISSFGPSVELDGYEYVIGAEDARLLRRRSLAAGATFTYRVWARDDALNTPLDGPQGSANPHPDGEPSDFELEFVEPLDATMLGFNTNPDGEPDPWLESGATSTRGNNVDAYADHTLPDGFNEGDDLRAEITGPGEFLHTYDPEDEPLASDGQIMASVTQLFYVTNWLHNWYYDSGFDEAAGNAQENNFGRGGIENDRMLAEAQDGARHEVPPRNNANMLTPPDGTSPRMQMYIWDGPTEVIVEALERELEPVGIAAFGPTDFDVEAEIVVVDDGSTETDTGDPGSITDACQPIQNDVSGAIALADRGGCTFVTKAEHAEAAGAVALLVVNNEPEGVVTMAQGDEPVSIEIPALLITLDDGEELRDALPQTVRMFRDSSDPDRDGTLDNTIVAHEWGHYIHFRLVEGCGITQQCRAMSEGFADFIALHMAIHEDSDLDGAYAVGQYAAAAQLDNEYFGVRRAPYSADFDKNALTFGHIQRGEELPSHHPMRIGAPDNAQVHNAGEVWASALLDAYVALLREREHEFPEARRRMSDYLVAGMKLAPPSPTYTEQLQAILAAVWAADRDDFEVMAAAFARRGMGSGSSSPPSFSSDLLGVVESFETTAELRLASSSLNDEIDSCDGDGVLDLTETGNLVLTFENVGYAELEAATIRVSTSEPALSFPGGDTVTIDALAPLTAAQVNLPVTAGEGLPDLALVEFELSIDAPGARTSEQLVTVAELVNYDVIENASRIDRVDSPITPWSTEDFGAPSEVWRREPRESSGVWRAEHMPAVTDSRLISPELEVGSSPLVVTFRHRHDFAAALVEADGPLQHYGGGVVEIRPAGGEWRDVSEFARPGYGGELNVEATGNPLQGRDAYVARSESYPEFEQVRLDLGTAFANRRVQLRFRIAAGVGAGAPGWEIDEIEVRGTNNRPFHELQGEGGDCETLGTPSSGCGCAGAGGGPLGSALIAGFVALWLLPRRRRAPSA